jgi:hypothetical protein
LVGRHALQALPILLRVLEALGRRLPRLTDPRVRSRLILVAAVGYLALLALLTSQALRGQSVVHPDAATLTALAGLVGVLLVGVGWSVLDVLGGDSDRLQRQAGGVDQTR